MIVTLGMRIANYVYSETDKCKDIIKNVDAKLGDQRRLQAYIPDTWRFMSDWVEGEVIGKEKAQKEYDRIIRDMEEKYHINALYIAQYAGSIMRLCDAVRLLANIVPSSILNDGTDLNTFFEYRLGYYVEQNLVNDVAVVGNGIRRLKNFLDQDEVTEIEATPWYESMEVQCRHYSQMRDYLYRVMLYQQEAIRLAKGVIVRDHEKQEMEFAGIDDAQGFVKALYDWAFIPYEKDFDAVTEENEFSIFNKCVVKGMTVNDSPMNDNKMNGIIMTGMLLVGAIILCLAILFIVPKFLIPAIAIMVLIEVINIVPQIIKKK